MSVLVFMDESIWVRPRATDYWATMSGVAIEEVVYDEFCRKMLQLKGRFFKKRGVGEYPLKGSYLLNRRALSSYRKAEFVAEVFSLCRLLNVVTFSATKQCSHQQADFDLQKLPLKLKKNAISNSDKFSHDLCSLLLAYNIERINSFMLESHPSQKAKLIFKTEESRHDRMLSACFMNFIYRTPFGSGFQGILGAPFFMPAQHSVGLQIADLYAYIINQYHGGRGELAEFYEQVAAMQFVSAIARDDFELRGMNLLPE